MATQHTQMWHDARQFASMFGLTERQTKEKPAKPREQEPERKADGDVIDTITEYYNK